MATLIEKATAIIAEDKRAFEMSPFKVRARDGATTVLYLLRQKGKGITEADIRSAWDHVKTNYPPTVITTIAAEAAVIAPDCIEFFQTFRTEQ